MNTGEKKCPCGGEIRWEMVSGMATGAKKRRRGTTKIARAKRVKRDRFDARADS